MLTMKKVILTLAVGLMTAHAFAQKNTFPASGNVGIGTTGTNNGVLTVHSNNNKHLLRLENDKKGSEASMRFRSKDKSGQYLHADIALYSTGKEKGYLGFKVPYHNDVNKGFDMIINEQGRLALGTMNTGNGLVTFNTSDTKLLLRLENDRNGSEASMRFRSKSQSGLYLHADIALYSTGKEKGYLGFKVPYDNDVNKGFDMIINEQGYVGIGTTKPNSKLTVAGDINSQEVTVTVDAGADFVFEKNYELPKLGELENFLKENKHLPQIPSEKEMLEKGLTLGEMNIKLLQKIEELTLYTIDQDKQIKELKKENTKMQDLEKRLLLLEQKLGQ